METKTAYHSVLWFNMGQIFMNISVIKYYPHSTYFCCVIPKTVACIILSM